MVIIMNPYVIVADSACDIAPDTLRAWGVSCCPLTFTFADSEEVFTNEDMSTTDFYSKMRAGGVARTAAANPATLKDCFEKELLCGNDVLYIGFSSGLSTTYHSAERVAADLKEAYPGRNIVTVDSLAASAGYGLLVYLAVKEKQAGKDLAEVTDFVYNTRLRVSHWFTVDDLVYLKRGGRVSSTAAFVGKLLGIKPVLHVDDEGHLIPVMKKQGRKASVRALAEKLGATVADTSAEVFISHGDCRNDAEDLAAQLKEKYGVSVTMITDIGPIIGAHSGPGTLALFFLNSQGR